MGVLFSIFWAIYKAIQYDAEKLDERVKYLEADIENIYTKLRKRKHYDNQQTNRMR